MSTCGEIDKKKKEKQKYTKTNLSTADSLLL